MNNSIALKKISLEILRIVSTLKWIGIDVPSVPQILTVRRSVVHLVDFRLKPKKSKTGSLKSAVESLDPAKNHLSPNIGKSNIYKIHNFCLIIMIMNIF